MRNLRAWLLVHGFGHFGGDLPHHGMGHDNAQGADDDVDVRVVRTMAFSPEAPRLALALSIWAVAMAFVPRAMISTLSDSSSPEPFDDRAADTAPPVRR